MRSRKPSWRWASEAELRRMFPNVAFPKPVKVSTESQEKHRRIAVALKRADPRAHRRKIVAELLAEWSRKVRDRDANVCQWCQRRGKQVQAHHIYPRSKANKIGWFTTTNGVTLCVGCHLFRLKAEPDEYVAWRDQWLSQHHLSYDVLRSVYGRRGRLTTEEMLLLRGRI